MASDQRRGNHHGAVGWKAAGFDTSPAFGSGSSNGRSGVQDFGSRTLRAGVAEEIWARGPFWSILGAARVQELTSFRSEIEKLVEAAPGFHMGFNASARVSKLYVQLQVTLFCGRGILFLHPLTAPIFSWPCLPPITNALGGECGGVYLDIFWRTFGAWAHQESSWLVAVGGSGRTTRTWSQQDASSTDAKVGCQDRGTGREQEGLWGEEQISMVKLNEIEIFEMHMWQQIQKDSINKVFILEHGFAGRCRRLIFDGDGHRWPGLCWITKMFTLVSQVHVSQVVEDVFRKPCAVPL